MRLTKLPLLRTCFLLIAFLFCANSGHAEIISKLSSGQNQTIAAIGTSLTVLGAWSGQMGDWLNATYAGHATIYNCGVGASASQNTPTYTSAGSGLGTQLTNALSHNPDAVFIEFGVNDAYTPYGITPQMSRDNLQAMIDQIRAWSSSHSKPVEIVVQTMNNVADINGHSESTLRPKLAEYYEGYRTVAKNNGVLLIDHYNDWLKLYNSESNHATWLGYMDEYGVHPNTVGSANIILPTIQKALLSETPEPSCLILLAVAAVAVIAFATCRRWMKKRKMEWVTES
jgi:lysophospholipase L1-like esterase